jgi:hypothetical protein
MAYIARYVIRQSRFRYLRSILYVKAVNTIWSSSLSSYPLPAETSVQDVLRGGQDFTRWNRCV